MSPVRISYVIVARNEVRTIGQCLKILLDQKVDEVIVVDGRSTDGTTELLSNLPVVHIMDQGKGVGAARQIGFKHCTGDYLVLIDPDQWVETDFDRKAKTLLEQGLFDVVYVKEIWTGGSLWARSHQTVWHLVSTLKPEQVLIPRIFKVSFLSNVGGWDAHFRGQEDLDLLNRVKRRTRKMLHSNLVVYCDASDLSVLTQFIRGLRYGGTLKTYLKRYPSDAKRMISLAPIGFLTDVFVSLWILTSKRSIKLASATMALRMASSLGWLAGFLVSMLRYVVKQ